MEYPLQSGLVLNASLLFCRIIIITAERLSVFFGHRKLLGLLLDIEWEVGGNFQWGIAGLNGGLEELGAAHGAAVPDLAGLDVPRVLAQLGGDGELKDGRRDVERVLLVKERKDDVVVGLGHLASGEVADETAVALLGLQLGDGGKLVGGLVESRALSAEEASKAARAPAAAPVAAGDGDSGECNCFQEDNATDKSQTGSNGGTAESDCGCRANCSCGGAGRESEAGRVVGDDGQDGKSEDLLGLHDEAGKTNQLKVNSNPIETFYEALPLGMGCCWRCRETLRTDVQPHPHLTIYRDSNAGAPSSPIH